MSTFNEHRENTHHIEFDAPNSAGVQPVAPRKHFSIDLSLELERQLDMESPPITPAHDLTAAIEDTRQKHEALDPEILAHIVMQLRHSLAEITRERDDLAKMLSSAHGKEASLIDALQLMTEKATEANEELDNARKRMKEDEEAIILLRTKVEESRRGVMRLQTESRRQSMAPTDVPRASLLGSPPSKRMSFTPMTGSLNVRPGHRRISSVSDTALLSTESQYLTFPPETATSSYSNTPPSSARMYPGLFGRQSPPYGQHSPPHMESISSDITVLDLATVKNDLQRVQGELQRTRHELSEVKEAKEASETCVKVLREFIADNNVGVVEAGVSSIKLPLPPTMTTGDEVDTQKPPNSGWGFKLWNIESPLKTSVASPVPQSAVGSPLVTSAPTLSSTPMTRKLGGFFSSRSSVSSNQSSNLPALQTNASTLSRETSNGYGSDASSIPEPISPGSDIHGLGTGPIVVRDVTYLSEAESAHGVVTADTNSVKLDIR